MEMAFELICSESAARELPEATRSRFIKRAIDMAVKLDQGQRAGDVFGFTHDRKEWKVVVNMGGRWAKILSRDELTDAIGKQ